MITHIGFSEWMVYGMFCSGDDEPGDALTKEEYADYRRVEDEFDAWQHRLADIYDHYLKDDDECEPPYVGRPTLRP